MTIDEAIIYHIQKADSYHKAMPNYDEAAAHRQLAEWLTELKNLREENKVLMQECDRLIKEKGELLSKVSGGDVLRIRQLEEQLQVELDNSHCLEIELAEAKRLLKLAVPIINNMFPEIGSCWGCANHDEATDRCKAGAFEECAEVCKWKHADEALKLLNDEK